ncbi:MAG: hypothetical protein DMG02_06150 [Acidobacteria bacterium]|nr:MAG: hypothetical protein DMG02_06150 [Acidobacteriota bacterium]
MISRRVVFASLLCLFAQGVFAQPPAPKEPPPLWDVQVGASFVGTSGNSEQTSTGADFAAHRRGLVWKIDSTAQAVRTTDHDASGVDLRSILDAGLSWALVRRTDWTLDGVTGIGWNHESRTVGPDINDPVGILQLLSRVPFGAAGDTTQRVTFYPDFKNSSAYRREVELTAQAAMNARLALKLAYLLRFSNEPVPGFKKTDNTTTASVVLRWKATTPAPAP